MTAGPTRSHSNALTPVARVADGIGKSGERLRAALSGEASAHLRGHERCLQRLATLLQLASSYREGREWTCECDYCVFVCGVRNYLAHHWTRGHAEFAISGGRWTSGSIWTRQHNPDVDDNRGYAHTYAPHVSIGVVSKALKQRRKFDAAARTLGQGAARFNLVPVVDGYMRCLSANCAAWRSENPVPTPEAHLDCRGLVDLVEMVHELRKASAGRQPGVSAWREARGSDTASNATGSTAGTRATSSWRPTRRSTA